MSTEPGRKVSIAFAMPIYGSVSPRVLASTVIAFARTVKAGATCSFSTLSQPDIARSRNELVRTSLETDPTYLMWLDGGIVVPSEAVIRLASHDLPVVGGVYQHKVSPHGPVLYDLDPFAPLGPMPCGDIPVRVDGMGMGCVLVAADLYRQMAKRYEDERWYVMTEDEGEDVWFFRRLKEMGIAVHVDPVIRCGHVREQIVTSEDAS